MFKTSVKNFEIIFSILLLVGFYSCESEIISPSFMCGDNFMDNRNNQNYSTVLIGTQCWMSQNLNYGSLIEGDRKVYGTTGEKFCFENDSLFCEQNGGLYTWQIIGDGSNLCPSGWHIPSDLEWLLMESSIGLAEEDYFVTGGTKREGADLFAEPFKAPKTGGFYHPFQDTPDSVCTFKPYFTNASGCGVRYWTNTSSPTNANLGVARMTSGSSLANTQNIFRSYENKSMGYHVRCIQDS